MSYLFVLSALIALSGFIGVYRIIKGPNPLDRILSLDYLSIVGIGAMILFVVATGEPMVLDVALCLALVGFVTAVVFARYLPERDE